MTDIKSTQVGGPDAFEDWAAATIWFGTLGAVIWPRSRGIAAIGVAVLCMRAVGHRCQRLERTIADLFTMKTATGAAVDELRDTLTRYGDGQRMNAEESLRSIAEAEERITVAVGAEVGSRLIDLERLVADIKSSQVGGDSTIMQALGRVRSRLDVAERCTCPPGTTEQQARDGDCPVHSVPF